jgi:hypothetical protein
MRHDIHGSRAQASMSVLHATGVLGHDNYFDGYAPENSHSSSWLSVVQPSTPTSGSFSLEVVLKCCDHEVRELAVDLSIVLRNKQFLGPLLKIVWNNDCRLS